MFWGVLWLSKMCVVPELWLLTCKPVPCERRTSFIRIWDFRNFYSLLKALPPLLMKWKWKVQVLVTQLCPTLCDPMVCGPPGYSVHGIHQARILEWVAMPFSRGSSWTRDRAWVPCIAGRFFIIWAIKEYHLVKRGQVWDWGSEQLVTSEKMKILVKQIKSLGISWAGLPSELAMYVTLKGMTWALWLRQKKKRPSRTWVSAPGGTETCYTPESNSVQCTQHICTWSSSNGRIRTSLPTEEWDENMFHLPTSVCLISCAWLFATPWNVARQAPLSMAILQARILEWGLPFPSPGHLPNPGIQPESTSVSWLGRQVLYYCATWEALTQLFWALNSLFS